MTPLIRISLSSVLLISIVLRPASADLASDQRSVQTRIARCERLAASSKLDQAILELGKAREFVKDARKAAITLGSPGKPTDPRFKQGLKALEIALRKRKGKVPRA